MTMSTGTMEEGLGLVLDTGLEARASTRRIKLQSGGLPEWAAALCWLLPLLLTLCTDSARSQGLLSNGSSPTGAITAAGQADTWTFDAQAGDHVFLRVSQTTGGTAFAPRIRVFDSGNNLVGTASGGSSSSTSSARLDYISESSGTFSLQVDSALAAGTGNYRVDFVRLPGAVAIPAGETGGPLDNEASSEGAIAVGDLDVWTFSADAGNLVELRAAQLSGGTGFVPRMRVFDSTGHLVGDAAGDSASSTSEARFSFRPQATNSFSVVVDSSTAEGAGNYRLHLLKLPGAATVPASDTGGPLTSGGNHDGSITLGDLDAWTFDAAPGEKVFLTVAEQSGGTAFSPRIRVYDTNGVQVAYAADSGSTSTAEARLEYIPSAAGTFTVVVDSALIEGTGTYRLFYLKVPGPFTVPSGDDGGALVSGSTQNATTTLGDLDVWTFDANTGDRVTLNLRELTGGTSYSPRARIFDLSGQLVGYGYDPTSSSSSSNSVILITPTNGTFSVVVDSGLVEGSGTYRLSYVLETGPFTPPGTSGTPLANGGNNDSSITVGSSNRWTLTAEAGDLIELRAGRTSGGFNPWLRLYDPNGELVDSGYDSTDTELTERATIAGTYTVVVSSFSAGYAGNYTLHYLKVPGGFTVPGGDEGGALVNGGNHDGVITIGDVDAWTLTADAGDLIELRAGRTSGGFNPWLRLYDPNGELVDSGYDSTDTELTERATIAGTYTVVVSSFSADYTGNYTLHYLKVPGGFTVPGGDEGGALVNGGNHDGVITIGDVDAWTLTADAGDVIELRAGRTSGGFYPWLRLYDPNGALVSSGYDASDTELTERATIAGTYTVVVSSWYADYTGNYTLHYLKVPGAFTVPGGDEGGALVNGGNHDGTITIGDVDAWTLTAEAGDLIELRAGRTSGGFYPWLRLYDPNGELVTSGYDASDTELTERATIAGTYTVVVSSWYAGYTGDYTLHYLKVPGAFTVPGGDEGGALVNGGNHDGTITIGDVDAWTLTAEAGDLIELRAGRTSGGFYPWLRLYDPNGELVTSGYDASDTELTQRATIAGTYTVVVSSWYAGYTGDYTLFYLKVPGAFTVPGGDEGGPLTRGGTNAAAITIGDLDPWTFEANQGDKITLSMRELTGGFYPYLQVYGPTGQLVASQNHSSLAQVSFTAPDSGLFVVVATSGTLGYTGTYQLANSGLPVQGIPLRVALLAQGFLTINWPSALAGYVLQENETLDPAGWRNVTALVGDYGLNARVSVPMVGNRFFRLRPPP